MKYLLYVKSKIKRDLKNNNSKLTEEELNKLATEQIKTMMMDSAYEQMMSRSDIKEKYKEYERLPQQTFKDIHPHASHSLSLEYDTQFLYHGIRFDDNFEKLEKIFKDKKILCGKKAGMYFGYDDNCNEGEYISLLEKEDSDELEYKTFIEENISLIISPECDAIKCIYVPFDEWEEITKLMPLRKNRYSYARHEYQVKDQIYLSMVRAIGMPYFRIMCTEGRYVADAKKQMIEVLMEKHNCHFPIVDTSYNNRILVEQSPVLGRKF